MFTSPSSMMKRYGYGCAFLAIGLFIAVYSIFGDTPHASIPTLLFIAASICFAGSVFCHYHAGSEQQREHLRLSEKRFRNVFNQQFQFMALLDPDGRVMAINDLPLDITGVTREQVLGELFWETPFWNGLQDMQKNWPIRLAEAARHNGPVLSEDQFIANDKSIRIANAAVTAVKDEQGRVEFFIIQATDITEQKLSEESLRLKTQRLKLLSETANYLFTREDDQRMLRELFARVAPQLDLDIFVNYRVDEDLGKLVLDSYGGFDEETALALKYLEFGEAICGTVAQTCQWAHYNDIQNCTDEKAALVKSLGMRAYLCSPLIANGRIIGTLSFGTRSRDFYQDYDVDFLRTLSSYVSIAKERLHREETVREALKKAESANIAKNDFLANMSHELRTPMNAVVGLSSLLQTASFSGEKQKEYLKTLQISAQSLMQIINDLLDISKIENYQMELEKVAFNPVEVIDDVMSIMSVQAKEKNLNLTSNYNPDLNRDYIGDPLRIRQIMLNLLSNAVKFTEKGDVTLIVESHSGQDNDLTYITIDVIDTGIGIPAEKIATIFSKFSQADTSMTRKYGGTGLGLSICKMLAKMMNGSIHVSSTVGLGSRFTVTLPLYQSLYPANTKADILTGNFSNKKIIEVPTDKPRILLVEDHKSNILLAMALLEQMGCHWDLAENGIEAIDKFANNSYDVILMDIQMPKMDGIEATKYIRNTEREKGRKHTPIIAMTAHSLFGDRERFLAAGMDDYLSKPYEAEDFELLMHKFIQTAA